MLPHLYSLLSMKISRGLWKLNLLVTCLGLGGALPLLPQNSPPLPPAPPRREAEVHVLVVKRVIERVEAPELEIARAVERDGSAEGEQARELERRWREARRTLSPHSFAERDLP